MTDPKAPAAAAPKAAAPKPAAAAPVKDPLAPKGLPDGREGTGKPDLPDGDPGINANIVY